MKRLVWILVVVVAVLAAGCDGEGTDVPGDGSSTTDGTSGDGSPGDGPQGTGCDPQKPFGAPVAVAELNSAADDRTAVLSADELTVFFASRRPGGAGGSDIYTATRGSRTAAWGTPTLLPGVNTVNNESRPVFTADGLTMYAETGVGADRTLSKATRPNTQSAFGALQLEAALNDVQFFDMEPTVLPDGSAIYFVRDEGSVDLYRARRTGTTWMAPVLAPGPDLNSSDYNEEYPLISADDLTLYFASNRAAGGTNGLDIYVVTRTSAAMEFGSFVLISELKTNDDEVPSWISSDGCEIWFSRGPQVTPSLPTNHDLYVARRPR
jgi:predicted small secreted protein